jgi:hypothetical protein
MIQNLSLPGILSPPYPTSWHVHTQFECVDYEPRVRMRRQRGAKFQRRA